MRRRPGRRSQHAADDQRGRRRPALHGRGHRRAAPDLHEGDPGSAEEPARRGPRPRPRREEGRSDRGHERRVRARAPRLRHDQAEADLRDDPDLATSASRSSRAGATARAPRSRGPPTSRTGGRSTGSAGAAIRSSGPRSCAARCGARSTTATSSTAKVADGRAQVTVDAIDSGDKFVNELDTSLEVIDPANNKVTETVPMAQTAAGRYTADFKIQKYGSLPTQGGPQARRQDGRRVAGLGRAVLPARVSENDPEPRADEARGASVRRP